MVTGTVACWIDDRGLGFIQKDCGGEIFCHVNDVVGRVEALRPGQRVKFNEARDKRSGRSNAIEVELIQ
jgi:CspA family cold shock protein